jgi:hypothetical protein
LDPHPALSRAPPCAPRTDVDLVDLSFDLDLRDPDPEPHWLRSRSRSPTLSPVGSGPVPEPRCSPVLDSVLNPVPLDPALDPVVLDPDLGPVILNPVLDSGPLGPVLDPPDLDPIPPGPVDLAVPVVIPSLSFPQLAIKQLSSDSCLSPVVNTQIPQLPPDRHTLSSSAPSRPDQQLDLRFRPPDLNAAPAREPPSPAESRSASEDSAKRAEKQLFAQESSQDYAHPAMRDHVTPAPLPLQEPSSVTVCAS